VTQLLGFAELLGALARETPVDPKQVGAIADSVVRACLRLGEVVAQIMEQAQLDRDEVVLQYADTTLDDLLRETVAPYAAALRERRLNLRVKSMRPAPPLRADPERLGLALGQLLSNAIKFTPDGGRIEISAQAPPPEPGRPADVEIIFADSGVGIDPQNQQLIFEKFYHVGSAAQHTTSHTKFMGGGAGLGLSIAKGIIEKHGGRVWVESPGHDLQKLPGSRFHVRLPLQPPGAAAKV
jgi:hypothetical protein